MLGIKNIIMQIKNDSDSFINRQHPNKKRTSELEKMLIAISKTENPREKLEHHIKEVWDNYKWQNTYIIGVPEEGGDEKGRKGMFDVIMAENF